MRALALILVLVLLAGPGRAQINHNQIIYGWGAIDCASFVAVMDAEREQWRRLGRTQNETQIQTEEYGRYLAYLTGFMTGVNAVAPGNDHFSRANYLARMMILERFCREQPMMPLISALMQMMRDEPGSRLP